MAADDRKGKWSRAEGGAVYHLISTDLWPKLRSFATCGRRLWLGGEAFATAAEARRDGRLCRACAELAGERP